MDSLIVHNVTKVIGDNLIIDDANFSLEKGKIYGLVGKNGSGKSTLLKIILGVYKSKGSVVINGYDLKGEYNQAIKGVGAIVDSVSLYEYLTAYENLRYFSILYEVPISRVKEVMSILSIKNDNKPVKNYSFGMKQKLGLAVALLKDPDLLILDEPMNGLDPVAIVKLRELLMSFNDKTIIISSHIMSEIEKVVDEVLFIHDRKIIMTSLKRDVKSRINFKLGNIERARNVLPEFNFTLGEVLSDDEVNDRVKCLVKEDVPIYRIEETSIEDMIIDMMGGEDK